MKSCGCGCGVRGFPAIERMAQPDRKTVRRYVKAATDLGLRGDDGESQLTDDWTTTSRP
jgi:hypothetical protein